MTTKKRVTNTVERKCIDCGEIIPQGAVCIKEQVGKKGDHENHYHCLPCKEKR